MERFIGKVAIVTGASAGIGSKISEDLANAGMKVVGIARRVERVQELATKINDTLQNKNGKLYAFSGDVTKEEDILKAFEWTKQNLGPIHVLVNNAGIHNRASLMDGDLASWKAIFDANVFGLSVCTREAIRNMKQNNINGHIIHMNSISGHKVFPEIGGMYQSSKYAVTALTDTLRFELLAANSEIKITSISPGVVESEMSAGLIARIPNLKYLKAEDISNTVLYVIGTPPHVQIHEVIIKPVGETS